MRHQSLFVLWWRHRHRPKTRRLYRERATHGVVRCHEFRKVESLVHERTVDHKLRIVEARPQLRRHQVKVGTVVDRHWSLVQHEQCIARTSPCRRSVRKLELAAV